MIFLKFGGGWNNLFGAAVTIRILCTQDRKRTHNHSTVYNTMDRKRKARLVILSLPTWEEYHSRDRALNWVRPKNSFQLEERLGVKKVGML